MDTQCFRHSIIIFALSIFFEQFRFFLTNDNWRKMLPNTMTFPQAIDSNLFHSFVSYTVHSFYFYHCCWPILSILLFSLLFWPRKKTSGFLFQPFCSIYCSEIIYRCILIYCTLVPFLLATRRQRKAYICTWMKFHRIRSRWVFALLNRTELNCRKWEDKKKKKKSFRVILYF